MNIRMLLDMILTGIRYLHNILELELRTGNISFKYTIKNTIIVSQNRPHWIEDPERVNLFRRERALERPSPPRDNNQNDENQPGHPIQ